MTDLQKEKIQRNKRVLNFLDSNITVFEKNYELAHFYKKLMSDHAQSLVSAEDLVEDDTAFNTLKLAAKQKACEMARTLCNTAKEAFLLWGDKDLYKKTKVGYLFFFRINDFYTEERLKELHKLLHNHVGSLSPEYITEEQLDEFKNTIKNFVETRGSSSVGDRPPSEVVARLKADLKVLEIDIQYIFKYAEKYKDTNETFYKGLNECNIIPEKPALEDTIVEFIVVDEADGNPLKGVETTFSKTSEKINSNEEGKITYTNPNSGRGVATFLLEGYEEAIIKVKVKSNIFNEFKVSLKKI